MTNVVQSNERPLRGFVVHFVGKDGRRASVAFDRYSANQSVQSVFYGRTDTQARNHAMAAALRAVATDPRYGPEWVDTYNCVDVH